MGEEVVHWAGGAYDGRSWRIGRRGEGAGERGGGDDGGESGRETVIRDLSRTRPLDQLVLLLSGICRSGTYILVSQPYHRQESLTHGASVQAHI